MATSKNETALKARQTKLNNKSKEELVNIVLKKDKIEKVLNSQVSKLKGENYILEKRIEEQDIKLKQIESCNAHLTVVVKKNNAIIEYDKAEIESYKNDVKRLNKESDVKYDVIVGLVILFILSIVMHLIR